MVRFQCGLKLSIGYAGFKVSEEVKVKVICHLCLHGMTQHELQSVLQMAAAYAGLGGAQVRSSCEPRPAAAIVSLGPLSE